MLPVLYIFHFWGFAIISPTFDRDWATHTAESPDKAEGSAVRLKTDLVVVDVTVACNDDAFLNPRLW